MRCGAHLPVPILGFCLALVCVGLVHAVLWVHVCICPVVSGKHCFLDIICHFWLLQYLYFFYIDN